MNQNTTSAKHFYSCPCCQHVWNTRDDLVNDKFVQIVGYQPWFDFLKLGVLVFNHMTADCGTTFSIMAGEFSDLYDGPIYKERLTGGEDCPGYCQQHKNLDRCPSKCACAYIREVIQIIKDR